MYIYVDVLPYMYLCMYIHYPSPPVLRTCTGLQGIKCLAWYLVLATKFTPKYTLKPPYYGTKLNIKGLLTWKKQEIQKKT